MPELKKVLVELVGGPFCGFRFRQIICVGNEKNLKFSKKDEYVYKHTKDGVAFFQYVASARVR
jgi:hypothetical protein